MKIALKLALLAGLGSSQFYPAFAEIIYSEAFVNTTDISPSVSSVGWAGYITSSATPAGSSRLQVNKGTGTSLGESPATGYLYANFTGINGGTPGPIAVVDTGLNLDLSNGTYVFEYDAVQSWNIARVQLLIQLNNQDWYVTTEAVTPVQADSFALTTHDKYHQSITFSTDASMWSHFSLTPGSAMSVGDPLTSSLSSATITGVGFYLRNINSSTSGVTLRIDSFTISSVSPVPEPASFATLAGGVVILAACAARRRR